MEKIRIVLWIIVSILLVVNLYLFFVQRDKDIELSAENYKACILKEYKQTPEQCRDANAGVYCSCNE